MDNSRRIRVEQLARYEGGLGFEKFGVVGVEFRVFKGSCGAGSPNTGRRCYFLGAIGVKT